MKHYFVKPHFSGWHEVDEKHFNAFIENIIHHSNMSVAKATEHIKTVTRIEEDNQ